MQDEAKRNFRLGVTNGVLFGTLDVLLDPTLVIATFIGTLTSSPLLIGLVIPISQGLWALPQLWVSGYMQSLPHKISIYRRLSVLRVLSYAVIAAVISLVQQPHTLLIAFFAVYIASSLIVGLSGLSFMEVVAKTVPSQMLGEFFALRLGLGGIGGVGASLLVGWVLSSASPFSFPQNYGFLAVLYFAGAAIALAIFSMIREPRSLSLQQRASFTHQIKRSLEVMRKNSLFRNFLVMQSTLTLAGMATPFFAIFAQEELNVSKEAIGIFLAVSTGVSLLSNYFLGRSSRKRGYQHIMRIAIYSGLFMSLWVLLISVTGRVIPSFTNLIWLMFIPAYASWGIYKTGSSIGGNSLLLEIAPEHDRSLYIGFSNTFLGFVLLGTGIAGVIIKLLGLQGLVIFTIIMNLAAWISALHIAREEKRASLEE
jgi:predicted MFS family arabinose efflux permease